MWSKLNKDGRWALIVNVLVLIVVLIFIYLIAFNAKDYSEYGIEVVQDLYTYKDNASRVQQDQMLKHFCSDEVYAQLTLHQNGTLYTFIDTAKELTSVNIIKAENDYVIYSLNNEQIGPDRRYVLFFSVKNRKVVEARECELFDFINFDESLY